MTQPSDGSSTTNALTVASTANSNSGGHNMATGSTVIGRSASLSFPISETFDVTNKSYSASFSFSDHPLVSVLKKVFASVEVVSVKFTVIQKRVPAATSSAAFNPSIVRYGLVPSGTAAVVAGAYVGGRIPNLQTFATNANFPVTSSTTFSRDGGPGTRPFPPGIQTDLVPAEVRFKWVKGFITFNDPKKDDDTIVFAVQIDANIECNGLGFGYYG